ncbi:50S ribosomal protein L10 [Candidatus Falkowbacteria bacterium CG10_big_fil_rev_8_21_14_0_10_44_15]|uniref:Large ribosomal subunit protein uL10 n=1 Tax=Candidatus Falkowbacteria bacterium CG10_big_fil_rev_8_21_14_0_10_44_15 TaxID=1974569 RepID=A0A2H0UZD9_9BACT|nr:MAG: 50S ribosomal protein L10 [Candidatus Falkowbacteria bacterium CG10_big_fil_rev_8_21_14_0_10_44_15]
MAINKEKKRTIVKELTDKFSRAKSVFFAKYFGVKANDINDLRRRFKQAGSEYIVAKKTLLSRALAESKIEGVNIGQTEGEVATIFGYEDEVAPAKILDEFSRTHESMQIIGGILADKFLSESEAKELAKLPSKIELYAKLAYSLQAPISGFVNALAGNLRNLMYALKAIETKK